MTLMDLLPTAFSHRRRAPIARKNEPSTPSNVFSHRSVLAQEVVAFLQPKPGLVVFDGTLGGGGHAELLLQAGATVVGCDRDPEALAHASARLACFGDRLICIEGNYLNADKMLAAQGIMKFDAMLLDLGVSSYQLDTAERGFSFQREGPLDMRMGDSSQTAADIVNTAELSELVHLFREYGDEPRAMTMATRIVRERLKHPITTTTELAALIAAGMPSGPRHPATRIFQALRIAVNEEITSLERALPRLTQMLRPGGRSAIITFHSLEDRLVKKFFKKHAAAEIDHPTWPAPRPNPEHFFTLPKNWSLRASAEEIKTNPRARSARLRLAERV